MRSVSRSQRLRRECLLTILVSVVLATDLPQGHAEGIYSNSWVHPSSTGNLLYRHDEHGLRITDFSSCGYKGGTVELPEVLRVIPSSRWISLGPVGGSADDSEQIQNALSTIGQWPLTNGFRGMLFLKPGDYKVNRTLQIMSSGIVLKGAGNAEGSGTRIWATRPEQYTLIEIVGPQPGLLLSDQILRMAQRIVPAGTRTFKMWEWEAATLAVDQAIMITRPFTTNWIADIDMNRLESQVCSPTGCFSVNVGDNWTTNRQLLFERQITRIEGPWVTVDSPLPHTFELQYGGGFVQKVLQDTRVENIGIEDVFLGSYYRGTNVLGYPTTSDEKHAWRAIQISQAKDVWVRKVVGRYFGMSTVSLTLNSKHVSVVECRNLDPISKISGSRRYSFHMDKGEHNLIRDCYSRKGRHDYAFGSLVPGPNANVRCRAEDAHADSGPHQGWAVGGLYDLIDEDGTWGAEFLGKVGVNVQNRGSNSTGHGWAGAYMTVWNCDADTFRVRNPPTARNWLIGSVGWVLDSQWWLPPVGDDPEGTYELAGPRFPPQWSPQMPVGRRVNPYSLYFAQLQQRSRWPNSQFREYWVGDIDDFGRSDGPDDVAPIDPGFLEKLRQSSGDIPVTGFLDQTQPDQEIAFTFTVPLTGAERVAAASLVLCMKATGPKSLDDALVLENPSTARPLRDGGYGWEISRDRPSVQTLEIDPVLLKDGRLNVAIRRHIALDWALLHVQVVPWATSEHIIVASSDTYSRGGSHKSEIHGEEPDFRVKNEDDGSNSRRGYLQWGLDGAPQQVVGATVRLYCQNNGQQGNVFAAALTEHEKWDEGTLNWLNQPPAIPPLAYFVPASGRSVEFSVTPQVIAAIQGNRPLSLQIWAPYDLGDAGFAIFASREATDPALRPQLILHVKNESPTLDSLPAVAIPVNGQFGPFRLPLADKETSIFALNLSAASSNPTLIPVQNIQFGGTKLTGRTMTIAPAANRRGTSEITLVVNDGLQTVSRKFWVRVGLSSVPPVVSTIAKQVLTEHVPSPRIPFTITDAYGRAREAVVTVSSVSASRRVAVHVTHGSDDPSDALPANVSKRFLILTPAPNFAGTATLNLLVNDGFNSTTKSFEVTVNAVNDPPGPVQLIEPDENATFAPHEAITLEAKVVDSEKDLDRVEFYQAGKKLGSVSVAPYRWVWTDPAPGYHRLSAVAVDQSGQRGESAPVSFRIGDQPEAPAFLAIQVVGESVTLSWDAEEQEVRLEEATELGANARWDPVETGFTNQESGVVTITRHGSGARYYRLDARSERPTQ